ncbi:MAG: hypothetical protein LC102_09930 [Ignavibacteriales bacterium]|nr:MAG: hypothetical protein F9K26_01555 [Ignavibacteriaceae bacterium]MBW7872098.1 hypothetical protein [Ignavibacteria bacterium]MCZ2143732.1 hypothetical protein [Ignavibacteriales bacterium]OQY69778.1 MAG: hypothetical protein B6D45_12290 [Ignavibacteriales bacterium UTCHB3]MBV6446006.1 hypothetical protein [Ignavibacteriaceae bacterium]
MKKLVLSLAFLSLVVFYSGCNTGSDATAVNNEVAKARVTEYLNYMVAGQTDKMQDFIAPSYIQAANIDFSRDKINTYFPKGFVIDEAYKSTDLSNAINVVVRLKYDGGEFLNKLTFVVFNDNGKVVFYPGNYDPNSKYLDPWYRAESINQ